MARFKFCLVGSPQCPIVEVDVDDLNHLREVMNRSRFVEGRFVEVDGDAAEGGILIATSRVLVVMDA